MSTYSPQTLGWWMDERRGELALTWQQVAEEAGVSTETLYRIADGRQMRTTTKKGVERALRWQRGSVDRILAGGKPVPLPDEASPSTDDVGVASRAPARVDPGSATWGDLRREIAWWHYRLRDTPEDYERLLYLLDLSGMFEGRPVSTQGGAQGDARSDP